MIVCSCNVLTKARVAAAAEALSSKAGRPVTAGRIFRTLGARPQCGGCLTLIRQIAADAGATVTCPEPLAMVSEAEGRMSVMEADIAFDVAGRVT